MSGSLDLCDIPKRILGDQKKAPGVKIQMKEVGCLFKSAEILPVPSLAAFLCFQQDAPLFHSERERIVKGSISFINAERQQPPDGQP